jgi:hypothetical protein
VLIFYYLQIAKLVPIMLIIFHLLYSKANFQTLLKIKFFFKTVCICLEMLSSKQTCKVYNIDNATSCKLIYLLDISYIKHRLRIQNISGKFMQNLQSFCHSVIFLSLTTLFGFRNRKYRTIFMRKSCQNYFAEKFSVIKHKLGCLCF